MPKYIWNIIRTFFNGKEIQHIYLNLKKEMQFFNNTHTAEDITEVIEIAIRLLLNAKHDYKVGKFNINVYNLIEYVSAAAWRRAVIIELRQYRRIYKCRSTKGGI